MKIQFIASMSVIAADPAKSRGLYVDTLGLPLEAAEGDDYFHSERIAGSKHFGVWPLAQAAQACFGTPKWPSDVPVPQACVEFEVENEDAVQTAAEELRAARFTLLHDARTEPWGQTVARLQTNDGVLVGISFAPWMHGGKDRSTRQSLFEHAGGWEGLHRLEQIFYDSVLADPLLAPLFGGGKPTHVEHLTMFTAESFGGPDRFTRELGFGHLIDVHRGLRITEAQRQRFVELYLAALDQADMPTDPAFRQAVQEHIEFGSHVALQNSNAETDEELHPLRSVPRWTWPGDRDED